MKFFLVFAVFGSLACAQPTPELGERVDAYLDRWDAWVEPIPYEQRAIQEMLDVDQWLRDMHDREGGERYLKTFKPDDGDRLDEFTDWAWTVELVEENQDRITQIREYAYRQAVGASLRDASWRYRREPQGLIEVASANPQFIDDISPQYWSMLREQAKLLRVDAVLAADEGDGERFIKNLKAMVNIARLGKVTGAWLDHLVMTAHLNMIASMALTEEFNLDQLDDEYVQDLLLVIDACSALYDLNAALVSERIVAHEKMQWLCVDMRGDRLGPVGVARFVGDRGRAISKLWYDGSWDTDERLRYLAESFALMYMLPSVSGQIAYIDRFYDSIIEFELAQVHSLSSLPKAVQVLEDPDWATGWDSMIAASLVLKNNVWFHYVHTQTQFAAARLRISAVLFQRETGSYPQGIEQIEGEFTDFYTGRPLGYKLKNEHPLIYSGGTDRDDDSGRPTDDPSDAWLFYPLDEIKRLLESDQERFDGDLILYPEVDE